MPPVTKAVLLVLLFVALLAVRLEFLLRAEAHQTLPRHVGASALVVGTVAADPDVREFSVRVTLAVESIDGASGSGLLLAVLPKDADVSYGDRLVVQGLLEAPEAFMTDTGRLFDYPAYLRVRGISALMQKARIIERREGAWSLRGVLYSAKHAFERVIERVLPAQDAALLEGILLGERRSLPKPLTDAFIIASLIHVVVLSGYNISIVAEATLRALRFLPRTLGYALAAALMTLFVLMTGAGSTALRAGIMALIAILARYARRPTLALRSLALAGALLALWNPLSVVYDPSFVLSFLATFGLIALSPWVEAHLPSALRAHEQLRSIAASTIAVQLYLLPALLYYTGILSWVALPANIVTLPLIPFAMLTGFLAGLLGFVHPLLALVPALLSDLVLRWLIWVAHSAASLPLSHATVPAFPAWVAVLVYVPFTIAALRIYVRTPTN